MGRILGERLVYGSGVEHNKYNGFISCYSPMKCVHRLENRVSSSKMLFLSILFSLKREFSRDEVGSTWHRMAMPFELGVWRNSDLQYRQLRLAWRIGFVSLTIPTCRAPTEQKHAEQHTVKHREHRPRQIWSCSSVTLKVGLAAMAVWPLPRGPDLSAGGAGRARVKGQAHPHHPSLTLWSLLLPSISIFAVTVGDSRDSPPSPKASPPHPPLDSHPYSSPVRLGSFLPQRRLGCQPGTRGCRRSCARGLRAIA